jgi:hypothetical protein
VAVKSGRSAELAFLFSAGSGAGVHDHRGRT